MQPAAVALDMDGVLVDTEEAWDHARRSFTADHGGTWRDGATRAMQGMSSIEWAAYLHDELGVDAEHADIVREVGAAVVAEVERDLAALLLPRAQEAVRALAAEWPLGLASSANREVIAAVLDGAALAACFGATVSSEEVSRGKPAPDVYLEVARRLGVGAEACTAVEDSSNGLRAAHAAGMHVVATPNRAFPPDRDALALATVVVDGIADVTPQLLRDYFMR
jgi:HAD superfamily hydrolase (TIGR01509 family)